MLHRRMILIILCALWIVACQADGPLATQIADSNGTLNAVATATASVVVPAQLTATPTPSATASPTPCCGTPIVTVTPRPSTTPVNGIVEISVQDIEWLAATCWIETRGMGDRRVDACTSVVSTILLRARTRTYSDGTIRGTLTYDCTPESETCAFPAWAVNGCEGIIPQVCPFYDTESMIGYQEVVSMYLSEGDYRAPCFARLYYGSRPGIDDKDGACIIRSDNGQWIGFFN